MDRYIASLIRHIKQVGAIQIVAEPDKGFTFKHHEKDPAAPLSPIKFHLCTPNARPEGRLSPADVDTMANAMVDVVLKRDIRFRGIAGLPNAGYPIAKAMAAEAYERGIHDVEVLRLQKLTEGGRRLIGPITRRGSLLPHDTVLVVDDLVFAATTKEEGLEQVRREFHTPCVVVFFDYEVGAREALRKLNAELLCVATVSEALDVLHGCGDITTEQYERCRHFIETERARRLPVAV